MLKRFLGTLLVMVSGAALTVSCESDEVSTSPADCADYDDDAAQYVTITIENHRSTPVFFYPSGDCFFAIAPVVSNDSGEVSSPLPSDCGTCQGLIHPDDDCREGPQCGFEGISMLTPGGSVNISWTATIVEEVELPTSCNADSDASEPEPCIKHARAPRGAYTAAVDAILSATCEAFDNPDRPCLCMPEETDGFQSLCQISESFTVGEIARFQTDFSLPALDPIVIRVE